MSDNLLTETLESAEKPSQAAPDNSAVPAKFVDPTTGEIRVEALLKSYLALEQRLSAGPARDVPPRDLPPRDLPDSPDGYTVQCDHGLFTPDTDINKRLFDAGFSRDQAQLLYDLAAERMVPLIQELAAEFQADREIERLTAHFGGEEQWRATARQIMAWANRNLPPVAVEGLSTTYDGIMALYRMMQGAEPAALGHAASAGPANPEDLMRDPRYWRDREPSFVAHVTRGFQQRYNDAG